MYRRWRIQQRLHNAPLLLNAILACESQPPTFHGGVQQHLIRCGALAPLLRELHVERDRLWLNTLRAARVHRQLDPG